MSEDPETLTLKQRLRPMFDRALHAIDVAGVEHEQFMCTALLIGLEAAVRINVEYLKRELAEHE